MKKNLKIVSAAAAALLAVAPIATMAVPANAGVSGISNSSSSTSTSENQKQIAINVQFKDGTVKGGQPISGAIDKNNTKVTASLNGQSLTVSDYTVHIQQKSGSPATWGDVTGDFHAGQQYRVEITGLKINGLPTSASTVYTSTDGHLNLPAGAASGTTLNAATLSNGITYDYDFVLPDTSLTGTPYFVDTDQNITSSLKVPSNFNSTTSVENLVDYINGHATPKIDGSAAIEDATAGTTTGNTTPYTLNHTADSSYVRTLTNALKAKGLIDASGNVKAPSVETSVKLTVNANNGKSATLTLNFEPAKATTTDYPAINLINGDSRSQNVQGPDEVIKAPASLEHIDLNSSLPSDSTIAGLFSATVTAPTTGNNNPAKISDIHVDSSKVNTGVAGIYPITVSATNPSGKTTKVTFYVHVGENKNTKYVANKDADVYNIDGNNVTKTDKTAKKDSSVSTFGTVTINGTSYTRINSADSHEFVLTSALTDKNPTPESNKHVRVWNKKESYIYNEHHVRQGNGLRYKIGSGHNVVANEDGTPKVYHVGGIDAYKLSDGYFKGHYVDVRNFTTKRANNNHKKAVIRSRVFDVRGKVVKHMYINKGATIKVYGTKKIKGHKMYKIAKHNRYVKVANFR